MHRHAGVGGGFGAKVECVEFEHAQTFANLDAVAYAALGDQQ